MAGTVDFATLGIGIDTSQIKEATADLDQFAKSAEKTEKAASSASDGLKRSGDGAGSMADRVKELDNRLANDLMATFDKLKNPLLAFTAALLAAVGGLAALGMKAIAFADDMKDIATATGKTYLELQTLGVIAEKSGTNLQSMQGMLDKVAANMAKAQSETSKQAQALKYFDVALVDSLGHRKTEAQLAYEVAKAYDESNHSASATAAAQDILTRNFREQLPALLELNTAQDEANKLKKYGAVVDQELADASDKYNETLTDVGNILKGVGNDIARMLLPLLQSMADTFVDSATNGGVLEGVLTALKVVFSAIADTIKVVWTAVVLLDAAFQAAGKTIGAFGAAAAAVFSGDLKGAKTIIQELDKDLEALAAKTKQRLTELWTEAQRADAEVQKVVGKDRGGYNPGAAKEQAAAAREAAKEIAELAKQMAKLDKEIAATEASTQKYYDLLNNVIPQDVELTKVITAYNAELERLAITNKEMTASEQALWDIWANAAIENDKARVAVEGYKKAVQALNEELKANAAIQSQKNSEVTAILSITNNYVESLQNQVQALKDVNELMGKSDTDQALIIANKKIDIQLSNTLADIDKKRGSLTAEQVQGQVDLAIKSAESARTQINNSILVGEAIKQSIADTQYAWSGLSNVTENFFHNLVDNGTTAFKDLGKALKEWFIDILYQMTVKKWMVSIGTSITGGVASAAGSAVAGGTSGGMLDGVINGITSVGTSLMSSFSGIGTAATNFSELLGHGVGVVDAFSMAIENAGLGLTSLVPVIGAIGAVGMLAYSFLKNKGGPKEGGFAASGETPGITGVDSSGRWMTPNQSDSNMLTAVNQMTTMYNQLISVLGGTGLATFAQGFSTDPKGTAPSNVHTGAWVNGVQIYDNPNGNVGRSSEELTAELQLQSKEALIAAFKAAGVSESITNYINNIPLDKFSTSLEDLAVSVSMLNTMDIGKIVHDAFDLDTLIAMTPEGKTLSETLINLVNVFATTDAAAIALGQNIDTAFGAIGLAGLEARQALVDLAGGVDALASKTNAYVEAFYSDSEKIALAQTTVVNSLTALQASFPELIQSIPQTKSEFRSLVESLDLSTESGRALFDSLMILAPGFASTADAATAAAEQMQQAGQDMLRTQTLMANESMVRGRTPVGEPTPFGPGFRPVPNPSTAPGGSYSGGGGNNPGSGVVDVGSLYGGDGGGGSGYDVNKSIQLSIQLLEAEGKTREALNARREIELSALNESDQAIQKRIWALQDEAAATQAATDLKTRILQAQAQIDAANGVEGAAALELLKMKRDAERAAIAATDASLLPMLESLYALEDQLGAMAIAARAAAQAAQDAATMLNLQIRLANASGNTDEAIRLQRQAELDAAKTEEEKAMLRAIYAAEDAAKAAAAAAQAQQEAAAAQQQAASAAQSAASAAEQAAEQYRQQIKSQVDALDKVTKSTRDYVKSLQEQQLALTNPAMSLSVARAAFRSAGIEDLPEAGNKFLEAAKENSGSRLEYLRALAEVINTANAAADSNEAKANTLAAQIGYIREGNSILSTIATNTGRMAGVMSNTPISWGNFGGGQSVLSAAGGFGGGGGSSSNKLENMLSHFGWGTFEGFDFGDDEETQGGLKQRVFNRNQRGGATSEAAFSEMMKSGKELNELLKTTLTELKDSQKSISKSSATTAKILEKFDIDGMPPERD